MMIYHIVYMKRSSKNKLIKSTFISLVTAIAIFGAYQGVISASKGDKGIDVSQYQSATKIKGYASDKFMIAQLGGYYNGTFRPQKTYATQVQYAIAQAVRAHTYIYLQASNNAQVDQALDYYLPKVQTPKGSIVALDVESGSTTTSAIRHGLEKVKEAGYTPVLYGYKNFFISHGIDYNGIAKDYTLWLAAYPNYNVTTDPNYSIFPSANNVGIYQFTSTYVAGGLDGNIDLTGITDNGYSGTTTSDQGGTAVKTNTTTPAIEAGQQANNTAKSDIKVGDTVKVNYSATNWSNNVTIPSWVKGNSYKVIQVSGNKVLLAGILSWANKSDVEILSVGTPVTTSTSSSSSTTKVSGTFKDGGYTITRQNGVFTAGQALRVFAYPGSQPTGAKYYKGQQIIYDGYVKRGNYIYVSYQIKGGYHHYIAVRNANTRALLGSIR